MLKEDVAVPFEEFVQDNPRLWAPHQLCISLSVLNRRAAQILAFQFDQIERNKHRIAAVALPANANCRWAPRTRRGRGRIEEGRVAVRSAGDKDFTENLTTPLATTVS
jgi:hypothetical protein